MRFLKLHYEASYKALHNQNQNPIGYGQITKMSGCYALQNGRYKTHLRPSNDANCTLALFKNHGFKAQILKALYISACILKLYDTKTVLINVFKEIIV